MTVRSVFAQHDLVHYVPTDELLFGHVDEKPATSKLAAVFDKDGLHLSPNGSRHLGTRLAKRADFRRFVANSCEYASSTLSFHGHFLQETLDTLMVVNVVLPPSLEHVWPWPSLAVAVPASKHAELAARGKHVKIAARRLLKSAGVELDSQQLPPDACLDLIHSVDGGRVDLPTSKVVKIADELPVSDAGICAGATIYIMLKTSSPEREQSTEHEADATTMPAGWKVVRPADAPPAPIWAYPVASGPCDLNPPPIYDTIIYDINI
eukprot:SAG31_NODE_4819_length_2933_cov_1.577629_4_plen_265_part_00